MYIKKKYEAVNPSIVRNSQIQIDLTAARRLGRAASKSVPDIRKELISSTKSFFLMEKLDATGCTFNYTMNTYPATGYAQIVFTFYKETRLYSANIRVCREESWGMLDRLYVRPEDIFEALGDIPGFLNGTKKPHAIVEFRYNDGGNHVLSEDCYTLEPKMMNLTEDEAAEMARRIGTLESVYTAAKHNSPHAIVGIIPEGAPDFDYFSKRHTIDVDGDFAAEMDRLEELLAKNSL